jgi:hypothetical protein
MDPFKYARTPHLPWSPGGTGDDVYLSDVRFFEGRRVVVTEKMDGENTGIYKDRIHARSLDSRYHPSRGYVNSLQARLARDLPETMRLAGENCYAEHSIHYSALPDWFLLFGVYQIEDFDGQVWCSSWDETESWADLLDLKTVPVLYRGPWDETAIKACMTGVSKCGGAQEGYVVRLECAFPAATFGSKVAKYVRKDHIQTDEHWMSKPVVANGLAR